MSLLECNHQATAIIWGCAASHFIEDRISINGSVYTLDDLHNIPHKYRYEAQPDSGLNEACGTTRTVADMDCGAPK